MAGKCYRDLIVWQKAFELAMAVYEATAHFPREERYGITSQIRKAAISIPSNIAEGQGRRSKREFRHFLFIALGSLMEVETQILISKALTYLKSSQTEKLLAKIAEVGRLLNGLSKSL
jgi:four helix bundle protein